ncbi:MAG TPA: hypothetical protein VFD16_01100, partial [Candidatus Saccharimonadales bacterium]|nr:hypothetical protein [Candidatus Saccharimonadales bacterium]
KLLVATLPMIIKKRILGVDALEKLAKNLQLKIMSPALKLAMNNSDGVFVSDSVLKLYLGDRRRLFAEKFKSKYDELLQKIN